MKAVMGKGEVSNKYLNLMAVDIGSGIVRLLNPAAETIDRAEINCFVCRFDVENGVADATALVFDTSLVSVIGGGEVDLRTEGLDISLKPAPKEGVLGGRVTLSMSELARPFRLGGTLADPRLALDPTQTALVVGKALRGMALFGPAASPWRS